MYMVHDLVTQRDVAMKVLPDHRGSFSVLEEVAYLASLPEHPNVCGYLYTRTIADRAVVFMPLAPYGSMRGAMRRFHLRLDRLVDCALQAACGLDQIHAYGIVHGDLKPENILLIEPDRAAIADFGVSRFLQAPGFAACAQGGTWAYRPRLVGPPAVSTDLYAWALVFLEAALGERPWSTGDEAPDHLARIQIAGSPRRVAVCAELRRVVDADDDDRPEISRDVRVRLREIREDAFGEAALADAPLVERDGPTATYAAGMHRVDLAGMVVDPVVLLVRALAKVDEESPVGMRLRAIRTLQDPGLRG